MAKKKKVAKKPKKIATKPKPAKKAPAKPAKKAAKKVAPSKPAAKARAKGKAKPSAEPKKKVAPKAAPAKPIKKVEAAPVAKKGAVKGAKSKAPAPIEKVTEKVDKKEKLKAKKSGVEDDQGLMADEITEPTEEGKAEDVVLTDAEGRRYCRVRDCDQVAIVDAYCRYHYLLFWKKIQVRKKILTEGKLQKYIEDLTARYPDKFLEILRKDLRSEKDFMAAIMELELDEASSESETYEDEDRSFIDEVRGVTDNARVGRDEDEY